MTPKIIVPAALLCSSSLWAQERPNIVLILADDMRASTLEFLGKEECKTPYLNELAQQSTVFTNAHIMGGGSSSAVSMPSRAMLMTGKYLYQLDKQGANIPTSHTLMGEVLGKAGYTTFHTGKWHNGKNSFNRCFNTGQNIFFGGMADHWNVPLFSYDETGEYTDKRKIIREPGRNNKVEILPGEYVYSGKHSVDIFTDAALHFIDKQDNEKPFFMSVCYMSPHDPRSMPEEFLELYDVNNIPLPDNFLKAHPFDNGELKVRDEVLAAIPRDEEEVKKNILDYYAMISHLDRGIGEIIQALKDKGLYDNTIIIFSADNGLAVGQHGLMGKQNLYQHSINIPLMIKNTGKDNQQVIKEQLCYLIDLFPTFCDMAGETIPESVDGISLLPIIKENKPVRNELYFGYRNFQRGIIDGEWKLIEYNVKG
ncbi:MAG: sulfatase-like hydrolase/transferase, partial [Odoribacter sp.]|nr:sulfatase-like hydrolase/transferase [Odoribacter sp.]